VVAAGRRDNSGLRRLSREQVGEGAARLERSGVLQEFELQDERLAPGFATEAEIAGRDPNDRRVPDIGPDQPLGRGDPGPVDYRALDARQNCTLPSEGGRGGAGGRWCTAGRVTLGAGNGSTAAGAAGGGGATSTG